MGGVREDQNVGDNKIKCQQVISLTLTQTPSPWHSSPTSVIGDNYGYLIHDPDTGDTAAAVDTPGDAKTYQNELDKRGWKLSHIFCTHRHSDHTPPVKQGYLLGSQAL